MQAPSAKCKMQDPLLKKKIIKNFKIACHLERCPVQRHRPKQLALMASTEARAGSDLILPLHRWENRTRETK